MPAVVDMRLRAGWGALEEQLVGSGQPAGCLVAGSGRLCCGRCGLDVWGLVRGVRRARVGGRLGPQVGHAQPEAELPGTLQATPVAITLVNSG